MTSEQGGPQGSAGPTFGEELRKEREIRGISLAEIAEATKISKRFLGAIEKNDFDSLPAPVFTRGFVREYARYLGLNAEDMVNRYAHYMSAEGKIAEDDPLPMRSSDHVPSGAADRSWGKRYLLAALVAVLAVLAAGGWLLRERWKGSGTAAVPSQETEDRAADIPPPAPSPPAAAGDRPMSLTLSASEDVWIVLSADGRRALSGILKAGEERTFSAEEQFEFESVGNAGGLSIRLDGVPMPALGEKGQVIKNRVISREGAPTGTQALKPSP